MGWTTLDGWTVTRTTAKAALLKNEDGRETWVPLSVISDGDYLEEGDTDIIVKSWFAEKEGIA